MALKDLELGDYSVGALPGRAELKPGMTVINHPQQPTVQVKDTRPFTWR